MTIEVADFRKAMRHLTAAVNIITAHKDGIDFGITATAVCSVTADPPSILVCVNKSTSTHDAIAHSGVYAVSLLSSDDVAVSNAFGDTTRTDRFELGKWRRNEQSVLELETAVVNFDCRVTAQVPAGSHSIFVGQIENVTVNAEKDTLIFGGGKYCSALQPL